MEWITHIQRAIDYMEEHLLVDGDYEDVAAHVGMSRFHFHRTFNLITGMTCAEYIRSRKLSIAGEWVSQKKIRIIDLAFELGYQTPESFTKAFVRFHGIAPKDARKPGVNLKIFAPLIVKVIFEGGKKMEYRIEELPAMKFLVKSRSFNNTSAGDENNTEIGAFWTEFLQEEHCISSLAIDASSYGLCAPVSVPKDSFEYGIGIRINEEIDLPGFSPWEVKAGKWAVFECMGSDGQCIGEQWKRIFSEFLPASSYEMIEDIDMEKYPYNGKPGLFCEIWIPVRLK